MYAQWAFFWTRARIDRKPITALTEKLLRFQPAGQQTIERKCVKRRQIKHRVMAADKAPIFAATTAGVHRYMSTIIEEIP